MNNMKKVHLLIVVALMSMLALPGLGLAADTPLVSVDWLAKNLKNKDLVLLDVGAFTHYEKDHIPGAVKAFGPWQTMNSEFVGFMMPPVEDLVQMLRGFGVNNDSLVVVYDEGVTVKDTAKSARALWTLHTLGHDKVAILDGGYTAWERAENPVTTDITIKEPGNFKANFQSAKVATLADVKSKIGSKDVFFVDTRIADEHFGQEKVSYIQRFGHLPGAKLWPASYMTNAGIDFAPSLLKEVEELKLMASGVGLPVDKNVEIITYSNQGTSAAMGYFVLHDILGYTNVKVFDGSMLEYAPQKDLALQTNSWGFASE